MLISRNQLSEFFHIQTGKWHIEFQEVYHSDNIFFPLCEISFDPINVESTAENQQQSHKNAFKIIFCIEANQKITDIHTTFQKDNNKYADDWLPSLVNEMKKGLASVLVRCGMARPIFEGDTIDALKKTDGAVIIPDTNSIVNGAFQYICRTYSEHIGYVALPENVEQELRANATNFKKKIDHTLKVIRGQIGNPKKEQRIDPTNILRLRPFGQNAFDALRRRKLPVEYEIIPILTSSIASASGDEEIIRTVADFIRSRHISAPVFFLTYDYNMARFCHLRGWNVIFCRQPEIKHDKQIYSVRYDYRSRNFFMIDIAEFLWEAAYAFNCLRITSEDKCRIGVLHSCKEGVSYRNWINDQMDLAVSESPQQQLADEITGKLYIVSLETFLRGIFGHLKKNIPISGESWKKYLRIGDNSVQEYLAFGNLLGLWEFLGDGEVKILSNLQEFIELWCKYGAKAIRKKLQNNYPVFHQFCNFLKQKHEIHLDDRASFKETGLQIKCLKYFPKVCELLNMGRVLDRKLLWTGEESSFDMFWEFLKETYSQIHNEREFVGIAEMINESYYKLNISHETFQAYFGKLLKQKSDIIETSGAIALASEQKNTFTVICPPNENGFIEKINLEDGFVIGSRTIKAICLNKDK